jgi:hypothetical protein
MDDAPMARCDRGAIACRRSRLCSGEVIAWNKTSITHVPDLLIKRVVKKKKAPYRLFLHAHREASALANELQEESEQFRFLRAACYANIKGSVGLILAKASAMRISIPLDLSSRSFIPLPRFMRSRVAPLLVPSLVFTPRRFA